MAEFAYIDKLLEFNQCAVLGEAGVSGRRVIIDVRNPKLFGHVTRLLPEMWVVPIFRSLKSLAHQLPAPRLVDHYLVDYKDILEASFMIGMSIRFDNDMPSLLSWMAQDPGSEAACDAKMNERVYGGISALMIDARRLRHRQLLFLCLDIISSTSDDEWAELIRE